MVELKKRSVIALVILCLISGGLLSYMTARYVFGGILVSEEQYKIYKETGKRFAKVNELYDALNTYYYQDLNEKDLVKGMCSGLFQGAGDPYTVYMTEEEYESIMIKTTGELEGIGVTVVPDKVGILIVSTVNGSPAEAAGMKGGDYIVAINGVSYRGEQIDEAVANLRGEAGTKVKVTYLRNGESKEITLVRRKITLQSIFSKEPEEGIGYIRVGSFETNTAQDFKKELKSFESKGAKGLIIDLRGNGGGIVESGIEIADMLLDEGTLAYTEGKSRERIYMNTKKGRTSLPYVVLIDGASASTSEIVSAGIKDNKGGKLVGTTTFGKGLIQTIAQLDTKDAVKITVAQYFSPKGSVINNVGVKPDYEVEQPKDSKEDLQLIKAIEVLKKQI